MKAAGAGYVLPLHQPPFRVAPKPGLPVGRRVPGLVRAVLARVQTFRSVGQHGVDVAGAAGRRGLGTGSAAGCAEAPPTRPSAPIDATASRDATRFLSTRPLSSGGLERKAMCCRARKSMPKTERSPTKHASRPICGVASPEQALSPELGEFGVRPTVRPGLLRQGPAAIRARGAPRRVQERT
jgi:hypothetical protein